MHNPKILLLDEPTAGVDISLRRQMWDFLRKQNEKGLTIVLTTHNLDEAELLCERIGIIDKGKIIALDKTTKLLDRLKSEIVVLYTKKPVTKLPKLNYDVKQIEDNTLEVDITEDIAVNTLVEDFKKAGIEVNRIKNKSNRLEELFLKLVEESK